MAGEGEYGDIVGILRRRWVIAAAALLTVLVTFLAKAAMEPRVYQASVDVLIQPEEWGRAALVSGDEPRTDFSFYREHATSNACLGRIIDSGFFGTIPPEESSERLDLLDRLERSISVQVFERRRLVRIFAEASDATLARDLANEAAQAFVGTVDEAKVASSVAMETFINEEMGKIEEEVSVLREVIATLEGRLETERLYTEASEARGDLEDARVLVSERADAVRELLALSEGLSREEKARGEGPSAEEVDLAIVRLLLAYPEGTAEYGEALRARIEEARGNLAELEGARRALAGSLTERHPDRLSATLAVREAAEETMRMAIEWAGFADREISDRIEAIGRAPRAPPMPSLAALGGDSLPSPRELDRLRYQLSLKESQLQLLVERLSDLRLERSGEGGGAIWVRPSSVPSRPIKPDYKTAAMMGLMIGLVIGLALALLIEKLDTSIKAPEDFERFLGITVLGGVPRFEARESPIAGAPLSGRLVMKAAPRSPVAEAYRAIARRIEAEKVVSVMITSSGPQEGKSTTTANLASAMAEIGRRTILVSANLRRPTLHDFFGAPKAPGISEIIDGDESIESVIVPTPIDHLDFLPSGEPPDDPGRILSSDALVDLIEALKIDYRFVLVDTPPVGLVADPLQLMKRADGVLLIYMTGKASRDTVREVKEKITSVGGEFMGVIMNDIRGFGRYGYRGYGYGYGYGYHYGGEEEADE